MMTRKQRLMATLAFVLSCGTTWAQGNFPPTAIIDSDAIPARPGMTFQLSGSRSSDPDMGPNMLTYSWDFGDGALSSQVAPSHVFTERGLFLVSLTVFDGLASSVATLEVPVLEPPLALAPVTSSPLALAGPLLLACNEDSASISVLQTDPLTLLDELPVGDGPVAVAVSLDAATAWIACRDSGDLWQLDLAARTTTRLVDLGRRPVGLVLRPGSTELVVTLEGESRLLLLSTLDPVAPRSIDLPDRPHGLAVSGDGSRAVVSDFLLRDGEGHAAIVDLDNARVDRDVALGPDPAIDSTSSGRGLPNVLHSVVIEPSGRLAHVGGLKTNVFRGTWRDGLPLRPTNRVRGVVAPIDLTTGLEREHWRFDLNDADSGRALAISADGRWLYVAHQGLGELSLYDVLEPTRVDTADGSAVPRIWRIPVGDGLNGLLLDGDKLHVLSWLSREVVSLQLDADPTRPPTEIGRVIVATETLAPRILNGKRMFHRSDRPRHSSEGYVACASCHPSGGHDAAVWDFTDGGEGLRNTTDLRGRGGTAHGPVHWSANFDEIQDFENDIVGGFGGTGLAEDGSPPNAPLGTTNAGRSDDLDDLAAYVATFTTVPTSPAREPDGSLSAAALRGKALFYSVSTGCVACHVPPRFTDSTLTGDQDAFRLHDVGTARASSGQRLGSALPGLDTPTLKLLWDGAPYLHDGRARSLRDVLTTENADDEHGVTSGLGPGELDDLVAFLLSIDDGGDVLPDPATELPAEVAPPGGTALRVDKSGSWLEVSWNPAENAETYTVSRGVLGAFDVHVADVGVGSCDTGGEVRLFDPNDLAEPGSSFYLVVARNVIGEGPTGGGRSPRTSTPSCP